MHHRRGGQRCALHHHACRATAPGVRRSTDRCVGVQACPSCPSKRTLPSRSVEAAAAPPEVRRCRSCTQLLHPAGAWVGDSVGPGGPRLIPQERVSISQPQSLLLTETPVLLEADRSGLANLQTGPGPRSAVRHPLGSVPLAPALQLAGSRRPDAPAANAEDSAGLDAATGGLRGGSLAPHDDQRQRRSLPRWHFARRSRLKPGPPG